MTDPTRTPLTAESEALLGEIYWTSRFGKDELTTRLAAIEQVAAAAERERIAAAFNASHDKDGDSTCCGCSCGRAVRAILEPEDET